MVREIMRTSAHLLTEEDEFSMTPEKEAEFLKGYVERPDWIYLVPTIGGRIIGSLQFTAGHRRRIFHQGTLGMSISPQYQGQGVGRVLMQGFFDWVETCPSIEIVRLEVHAKNAIALKLYESFGFREEGREVRGVKMPDGTYDDSIMMARSVR